MKRTQSNSVGLQERRARRDRLNRRLVGYTATAGAALAIAGTAGTANAGIVVDAGFTGPITVNSGSSPVDVNIVGGTAGAVSVCRRSQRLPSQRSLFRGEGTWRGSDPGIRVQHLGQEARRGALLARDKVRG